MDKSLLKKIISIIKVMDLDVDYISKVKYVIFFISKVLLNCKIKGLDILDNEYTPDLSIDNTNILKEYDVFNLNDSETEKKLFNLLASNKKNIDIIGFKPAKLYESLLTSKEKKILGQVYTPDQTVQNMIDNLFNIKNINEETKILDPSCGGGYFLIELFKKIRTYYKGKLNDKYVIENMLYGIDIDNFSIFLTKMGIYFASNCTDLNFNIYNIDYLTDNLDLKFDIIIGNPPYIGHKNTSKEYRETLYQKYPNVYYDKADISYCFFAKSKEMLKDDGIISFITSRYFMEALYADRIRAFIKNNYNIVSLIDFSGIKVFKDAMVSPALITLSNITRNQNEFTYVLYNENFDEKFKYKQDKLKNSGWIILKDVDENLFNRIHELSNTYIKNICSIKQGIITGLDKAFIVDEETIEKYNIESNLLKKWIKNSNITKTKIKYNNLYLIYSNDIHKESEYPNAIKYLSYFKEKLQRRRECLKGYRKWYELQWGRIQSDFENPKIVFPYKSKGNNFYYDENKYFCSADVYLMNNFGNNIDVNYLLAYLNSDIFEFYFKCCAKKVGNNVYEYYPNKLNNVKIFLPQENTPQNISDIGKISIENYLKRVFNITEEEVNSIIKKYINRG